MGIAYYFDKSKCDIDVEIVDDWLCVWDRELQFQ